MLCVLRAHNAYCGALSSENVNFDYSEPYRLRVNRLHSGDTLHASKLNFIVI